MAVYRRTFKVYRGPLTASWSRFTVLTRYSLSTLFSSRFFTVYFVICFLPILVGIAYIYLAHSATAKMLLGMQYEGSWGINNIWFAMMHRVQTGFGFILVAWAAPGMITRDFANQALQVYFSRPLSRTEYIVGKTAVLAWLLSWITWIPGLLFFAMQAGLEGNGWGWNNLYLVGAILLSSWIWIAVMSLVAFAVSVFVRWRIAATGLFLAVMFVLPGFARVFDLTLRTYWGELLSLPYTLSLVWLNLFRIERRMFGIPRQGGIPVWSAWASVLTVCLIAVLILNRRLKAREVVRG